MVTFIISKQSPGITLIQRKLDIYKDFVCPRCNTNKEENRFHFIECDANKDLWPIIKSRIQDDLILIIQKLSNLPKNTFKVIREKLIQLLELQHDDNKFIDFCLLVLKAKINTKLSIISKQTFGFSELKNILFLASLLDSFIIHFKELIWHSMGKKKEIERKDKLNISENMNWYFKFSYQQAKHLRQDKQQLKKNNLPDSQKNQTVILNDIQSKLNSIQQKNLSDEDSILLKCYKVEKKLITRCVY